jgi:hypothetical protein
MVGDLTSKRWTFRILAATSVLLALMCAALAIAWTHKAEEAACYRSALADGETPTVADTDCGGVP